MKATIMSNSQGSQSDGGNSDGATQHGREESGTGWDTNNEGIVEPGAVSRNNSTRKLGEC